MGAAWRKVDGVDWSALRAARLQAHYAVQWLARAARAYVPMSPNDHHTNLGWDDAIGGLTTHAFSRGAVLGLDVADLTLTWRDSPSNPASVRAEARAIGLAGRRDTDIRAWLGGHLSAQGLDAAALDAPSPYQMPEHPLAHGAPYGAAGPAALAALAAWFANANQVLDKTRQDILARGIDAPLVRCWPHHFDLDSLIALAAAPARTVGLGFCPGDEYYDQPYFYVSCHPRPDVAALPHLPPVGHWHTHHFTAAVAIADRILEAGDQRAATQAFLRAATDILLPPQ
ncbi:MAG TPA: hypothetical protein VGN55_18220 [Xanthobacteraceae bacterium]